MAAKTEFQTYFVEHLPHLLPNLTVETFQLDDRFNGTTFDFVAEVKVKGIRKTLLGDFESIGQPRHLRRAITELRESGIDKNEAYLIVAAPFLSKRGLEVCRKNQIGCLDLAGNLYLEFDGIYIERIVDANPKPERRAIKSLFTPISSRIIRVLLDDPKHTWQLTELANRTGASIGQVYNVSRKLTNEGFAHKTERGSLTLTNPTSLLDGWREQYSTAKNQIHRFHLPSQSLTASLKKIDQIRNENQLNVLCTAHTALYLLTDAKNIQPTHDVWLYVDPNHIKILTDQLSLHPSDFSGTLQLMVPYDEGVFYRPSQTASLPVVSNIQLYLDLYQDPLQGRKKAAQFREQQLGF